ncbi:MAG: hotdog fold thioesterase [Hymenobacter sp.]
MAQQWLTQHDPFSTWLGVELAGSAARLLPPAPAGAPRNAQRFWLAHGGITFAAADTAFSVACNAHGRQSVGLSATIDYLEPGRPGDSIIIEAEEMGLKQRIGVYEVRIRNQEGLWLALFKGTAYRTSQENKLLG